MRHILATLFFVCFITSAMAANPADNSPIDIELKSHIKEIIEMKRRASADQKAILMQMQSLATALHGRFAGGKIAPAAAEIEIKKLGELLVYDNISAQDANAWMSEVRPLLHN